MTTLLALAIGGVLGCWARYGLTLGIQRLAGARFPYATLTVNVVGSFLLAFLFVLTLERLTLAPAARTGVLTGGLGAFTTFSTFIMEAVMLIESGQPARAGVYLAGSVILGLAAAVGGVWLARQL